MSPPPSSSQQTPAPRRFFLPKRGTPSQTQTQTPATATATAAEAPRFQFQSTPRFGPPSTSRATQQRGGIEDVEEDEDVVEESSLDEGSGEERGGDESKDGRVRKSEVKGDRIEVFSRSSSMGDDWATGGAVTDEPAQRGLESEDEEPFSERRSVKRRRISISPLPSSNESLATHTVNSSPSRDNYKEPEADEDEEEQEEAGEEVLSQHSSDASDLGDAGSPSRDRTLQQPTFRAPPRFKALDQEGFDATEGLPPAFSPQRRGGPKYIAGGLASELQGWLSEVKGWGGSADGWTGPRFKVVLEDVRPGRRMYLTKYSMPPGDEQVSEHGGKLVLAGEGKLTGLGQKADVKAGSVVEVNHPLWDIQLEGSTWLVACDWSVQ